MLKTNKNRDNNLLTVRNDITFERHTDQGVESVAPVTACRIGSASKAESSNIMTSGISNITVRVNATSLLFSKKFYPEHFLSDSKLRKQYQKDIEECLETQVLVRVEPNPLF